MKSLIVSSLALLTASAGMAQQAPTAAPAPGAAADLPPLYKSPRAPVAERVRDLLGRMTPEEKVAQLQANSTLPPIPDLHVGPTPAFGIVKNGQVNDAVARRALGNGIGTFVLLSFSVTKPAEDATQLNLVQSWLVNNTRLGIPAMFQSEALHGAALNGATSYPQAIGLGSTWDRALLRRIFAATGRELRVAGLSQALAPVFDLARDPRYGRVEEMYSEDPYLVGELGIQAVRGLQGDGATVGPDHVVSTAKHFVHGQPENGTNVGPNDFSERTMRSVFLAPFEKAVRVGHIGAVMPSYNENDGGLPSSVDPWLLKQVLRREWGFQGVTVSDWGALPRLAYEQGVAASEAAAGVRAFNAGTDVELPNQLAFNGLLDAVRAGTVAQADLDAAVARVLTTKFNAGLFEHPYADVAHVAAVVGAKENAPLARQAADEAMVLLRNEGGLLPLDPARIRTLAVVGPNADKIRLGTYSSASPAYFVTVLDGIRKRLGSRVKVDYAQGVGISVPDTEPRANKIAPYQAPTAEADAAGIRQAVETARGADAVVLVLGGNETISREAFAFSGKPSLGDTDELELPGRQNELVREIMKLGKPTVAVLINGRPYSVAQLSQAVPAILEGWYLGQETGNAVAGALFGDTNPSGRLPVTIARNVGQLPVFYYRQPTARLGYVFNDNTPLYPFGYGLSYTTFGYGTPVLDRASIARTGTATVSVTVTNTGRRAGAEVVQMYVHPKVSSVAQPVLRLAGFERVMLAPGQSRTVSFPVGPEQLAIWNDRMQHVVEAGKVDVMVGPNAAKTTAVSLDVTP